MRQTSYPEEALARQFELRSKFAVAVSAAAALASPPIQVTLTHGQLTLALRAEGESRPVGAPVRDDVRQLSVGDRTVFELNRDYATTVPCARD